MQPHILNSEQIQKKITRIAYEIYEDHADEKEIILAGIAPGGSLMVEKLNQVLKKISPLKIQTLTIEIDKKKPIESAHLKLDKKQDLKGKCIILVDDVLNTGKILAYSMKAFLEYSIKSIHVAVLVDRNHTLFPVKSDYTGLSIATTLQEHIEVNLKVKGKESVVLKD